MLEAIINNDKRPKKRPCKTATHDCPFFQLKGQLFVQGPYIAGGAIYIDIFDTNGAIVAYIIIGDDGIVTLELLNEPALIELPKFFYNVLFKVLYMAAKNDYMPLRQVKGKNIEIRIKKEILTDMPPYAKSLLKLGIW